MLARCCFKVQNNPDFDSQCGFEFFINCPQGILLELLSQQHPSRNNISILSSNTIKKGIYTLKFVKRSVLFE